MRVTWWAVKCSCSWGRRCTVLRTPLAQQRSLAFQKFLLDEAAGLCQPCAGESSAVCLNSDWASQSHLLVCLWFLWWSHLQEGRDEENPSSISCCALGFTAVKTEHSVTSIILSACAYPFDPYLNHRISTVVIYGEVNCPRATPGTAEAEFNPTWVQRSVLLGYTAKKNLSYANICHYSN